MEQVGFAQRMVGRSGNVIRELLKLTQKPDIISFAGGLPAPESFPVAALQEIATEVIGKQGRELFQYGTSEGYQPLREYIADWVKERGIEADASQVLSTSGSQQGIDLMGKAFLDAGDGVLVEEPTYLAALQILGLYQGEFSAIATDDQGPIPAELRALGQSRKHKLMYLVPTFQNPTGITIPLERRPELLAIAKELDVVVMEDDPYGELRYSGETVPALKSFDEDGRVVYLGSFSKIISPGLRVGFAIADPEIFPKLTIGKQSTDTHTSNLTQAIVYEFCSRGLLAEHLPGVIADYREKRDLMLDLLDKYFDDEIKWTRPEGGLFLWLELPEGVSATEMLKEALKEKVAFIPGASFFASGAGDNTIRLNFSNPSLADIEEGMVRLSRVIKEFLAK